MLNKKFVVVVVVIVIIIRDRQVDLVCVWRGGGGEERKNL